MAHSVSLQFDLRFFFRINFLHEAPPPSLCVLTSKSTKIEKYLDAYFRHPLKFYSNKKPKKSPHLWLNQMPAIQRCNQIRLRDYSCQPSFFIDNGNMVHASVGQARRQFDDVFVFIGSVYLRGHDLVSDFGIF